MSIYTDYGEYLAYCAENEEEPMQYYEWAQKERGEELI